MCNLTRLFLIYRKQQTVYNSLANDKGKATNLAIVTALPCIYKLFKVKINEEASCVKDLVLTRTGGSTVSERLRRSMVQAPHQLESLSNQILAQALAIDFVSPEPLKTTPPPNNFNMAAAASRDLRSLGS